MLKINRGGQRNRRIPANLEFFLLYTALFALIAFFGIEIHFLLAGKTLLVRWDTFDQQYLVFIRIGKWIRALIRGQGAVLWDPAIGYGSDFLITLSPYVMNPLYWLSALIPPQHSELFFVLMLFVHLWLCGLTFSVLGFSRGREKWAVLCGMLTYAFSGSAFLCLYQSQFFVPMILFPLIICGTDRLLDRGKPGMYVLTLAYSAIYSFYHTWMIAVLTAVYTGLRLLEMRGDPGAGKRMLRLAGRFLGCSMLSAGLAAVSLVPMAKLMLGMERLSLAHEVPLFYSAGKYWRFLRGAIIAADSGPDSQIGWPVCGLVCVFLLMMTGRKEKGRLKAELLLGILCLCIPALGYFMNGLGYVTNRWAWGLSLLIAWIVTEELPSMRTLPFGKRVGAAILSAVYLAAAYFLAHAGSTAFLLEAGALAAFSGILFLLPRIRRERAFRAGTAALCSLCALLFSFSAYGFGLSNFMDPANMVDLGAAWTRAEGSNGLPLLDQVDTSDGTRYSDWGLPHVRNASWLQDAGGTTFYMSFYNQSIDRFHSSLALKTDSWSFGYDHPDGRSELYALLGINHFFTSGSNQDIPAAFGKPEAETADGGMVSWTSDGDARSLCYLFDRAVSEERYEALSPYERQQLLMQAVVLEGPAGASAADFSLAEDDTPCNLIADSGNLLQDGQLTVAAGASGLTVEFPFQTSGELYLDLEDIHYQNGIAKECYLSICGMMDDQTVTSSSIRLLNGYSHMYGGKHNWLVCLGRIGESVNRIRLTVDRKGTLSFRNIRVHTRPMAAIQENLAGLEPGASDISFGTNEMEWTTDIRERKHLFISIPYSEGWTATDNGKPVPLRRADLGFLALELEPGEHHIRMTYMTPGLRAGALISLLTACAAFGAAAFQKKRRKRDGSLNGKSD